MVKLDFEKDIAGLKKEFAKLEGLMPQLRREAAKLPGGVETLQAFVKQLAPAKEMLFELLEQAPRDIASAQAYAEQQATDVQKVVSAIRANAPPASEPAEPPAQEPDLSLAPEIGALLVERYGSEEVPVPARPTATNSSTIASWSLMPSEAATAPYDFSADSSMGPTERSIDSFEDWLGCSMLLTSMPHLSETGADVLSGSDSRSLREPPATARTARSVNFASASASFDPNDAKRRFLQWRSRRQDESATPSES